MTGANAWPPRTWPTPSCTSPVLQHARRSLQAHAALGTDFAEELSELATYFSETVEGLYAGKAAIDPDESPIDAAIWGWLTGDDPTTFSERVRQLAGWSRRISWGTMRDRIVSLYGDGRDIPLEIKELRYILTNWRHIEGDITGDAMSWSDREALVCFREDMERAIGHPPKIPSGAGLTPLQADIVNAHRFFPRCQGLRPNTETIAKHLNEALDSSPELSEFYGADPTFTRPTVRNDLTRALSRRSKHLS